MDDLLRYQIVKVSTLFPVSAGPRLDVSLKEETSLLTFRAQNSTTSWKDAWT